MSRTRQKLVAMDAVEEIARRVPGYRGYHDLTQRRDDDRRFRSSIAEHLAAEAHRLERIEGHQFRDDFSDLLEEVDAGARKLEFLADAISMTSPAQKSAFSDDAAEAAGTIDRQILDELDRLHRLVHELEKAYVHDERFEMNLAELRGITESIADLIELRNVALTK